MAERRNGTPSVEDSTRLGPQGSSGAIPNQRERPESTKRDSNSGGDNNHEDVTALLADTAEGNNTDNPSPPQTLRHQQNAQHPNQSSTSRRPWWQKIVGGRSRTPRRKQERQGRAETPGSTGRTMFSLGQRRPATTSVYTRYATTEYEEKGEEKIPLRGDDYEREQTPAAPETPLLGRQQGDPEHTNQYGRARPGTRTQGRRMWTPLRQRAARATQEEGRQEHTMTPGRRTRLAMGRGRTSGIQQVDARRDHRPAGLDLNPTPERNHGGFTREEKTAGFDDAVESNHPPPLATTPRRSRRIFHDRAQTPGRARSAPVGPRLRDEEEEVIAQRRARWEKAVAAVNLRATRDKDEVDEIHWPDRVEPEDVCTQAPSTSRVRVTLFLQTGQRAREHANVLKTIFPHSVVLSCNGQGAWPGGESLRLLPGGTRRGVRLQDGSSPYSTIGPIAIVEDFPGGHLYDEVVAITSLSSRSRSTLETAFAVNSPGSACLIYHDKSETPIATMSGDMTLTRRTGVDRGLLGDSPMAHTLTTIFEIKATADAPEYPRDNNNAVYERPTGTDPRTVARCVVAYRDASRWSSVGPSIRWFMVRRDYQGIGLAQQLFDEVEKWYVKNWTLSTNKGNRVLKATKLKDYIVDRNDEMEGRPPALITDKMFFYDVMNFKCILPSIPLNRAGFAKLGAYVPETHAIKIYPPTGEPVHLPTVDFSMPFKIGWRSCDSCKKPEDKPGMNLVCGRCTVPGYWRAHYCSRSCQYQDWPTHKLWCGKTLGEVLSASPFHDGTPQALE